MAKTLVIGASENPERYAYKAANMLLSHHHDIALAGIREGKVFDHEIQKIKDLPNIKGVDTVTMYIGPKHQGEYYDYIINSIQPRRVIFNPGTENQVFYEKLASAGIDYEEACTLVLLQTGQY